MLQPWIYHNTDQPVITYPELLANAEQRQKQGINRFDLTSHSTEKDPTVEDQKKISGTEHTEYYDIHTLLQTVSHTQETQYSDNYITMRLNTVLFEISKNLDDWATNGTDDSVVSVYNIKKLLDDNSHYFEQSSRARLLSAALELIFENNNWNNIPLNQVKHLSSIVKNFQNKDFDEHDIFGFLKSLKQTKIQVMKPYHDKEEKQA